MKVRLLQTIQGVGKAGDEKACDARQGHHWAGRGMVKILEHDRTAGAKPCTPARQKAKKKTSKKGATT